MATTGLLSSNKVGTTVYIFENGIRVPYIIVHNGKPSDKYDDSCDGIWLLRSSCITPSSIMASSSNSYSSSQWHVSKSGQYINTIDDPIRSLIKRVRIPYKPGNGNSAGDVANGSEGTSTFAFLLSLDELGLPQEDTPYHALGSVLDYFISSEQTNRRASADYTSGFSSYWTRTPYKTTATGYGVIISSGANSGQLSSAINVYFRPVIILPNDDPSICVDPSGNVVVNHPITMTVLQPDHNDLGVVKDLRFEVIVDDDNDSDNLLVRLEMDGKNRTFINVVSGESAVITPDRTDWLSTTNGEHYATLWANNNIQSTDPNDSRFKFTFTRNQTSAYVTLIDPITPDDFIYGCTLTVNGSIPDDAVTKYEVTNNANDSTPSWETYNPATNGYHVFRSLGSAFNFRISISRGESGEGGYITSITGGLV